MFSIEKIFQQSSVYVANALVAIVLVSLYFIFYGIFRPISKHKAKFFLCVSIGWLCNLVYLWFLYINVDEPMAALDQRLAMVLGLNTASNVCFICSNIWHLGKEIRAKFLGPFLGFAISMALLPIIITIPHGSGVLTRQIAIIVAVCFGCIAIGSVGYSYHAYFRAEDRDYSAWTKFLLIVPLYGYALLQLAAINRVVPGTTDRMNIDSVYFSVGTGLKLLHIFGMCAYARTFLSDYSKMTERFKHAKREIKLVEQFEHEVTTPATELRLILEEWEGADGEWQFSIDQSRHIRLQLLQVVTLMESLSLLRDENESTRVNETEARISVNTLCDSAIMSLKSTTDKSLGRVKFQKKYEGDARVFGKPSQLLRCIRNLVKNAMEATTGKQSRRVLIEVMTDEHHVYITVSDNGPGVDKSIRRRIFEDGYSTKDGSGRGHGLAIARSIAIGVGGAIELLDRANCSLEGASFKLTFPKDKTKSDARRKRS